MRLAVGGQKLIFFVLAAFVVMALVSYFYVSGVVKRQIDLHRRTEIALYQSSLKTILQFHEAALRQAAVTLAWSFDRRDPATERPRVFQFLNVAFSQQPVIREFFNSVYGYLEGNYIDHKGLIPGAFFNPKTAAWVRGALLTNGIYHGEPYLDPKSGRAVVVVSMVVYDQKGQSRGVVALDFSLTPILESVSGYEFGPDSFALLTDSSFRVLYSPNPLELGEQLDDLAGFEKIPSLSRRFGQEVFVDRLERAGVRSVGFFGRLENNWLLAVVTPETFYYREASRMIPVIAAISLGVGLILSALLLRFNSARSKLEVDSQVKATRLARLKLQIRGPMMAMMGFCEMAQRDYGQPQGLAHIAQVRWVGDRLMGLCGDLLESDLDNRKRALGVKAYHIQSLLTDILIKVGLDLKDKPIQLLTDIANELPRGLIGDERAVSRVIGNLLAKAIQRSSSGFVKLSARRQLLGDDQARLFFTVEDNAGALTAEELANLFVDFERLAGRELTDRTGLELSVARGLCQTLGGDLVVENEFERGLKAVAFFTQKIGEPEPLGEWVDFSVAKGSLQPFPAPGLRILAVDGAKSSLKVFGDLLEPYHIRLTTAYSGLQALELARNIQFDLLFIDQMTPELDGVATLKSVRAIGERYLVVPAIVFIADFNSERGEKLLSHGFDDFIVKPVEANSLAVILDRWTPLKFRQEGASLASLSSEAKESQGAGVREAGVREADVSDATQAASANIPGANIAGIVVPHTIDPATIIDQLDYPGLNVLTGVERCGQSQVRFLRVLAVFIQDAEELGQALVEPPEGALQAYEDLAVKAHALKGGAAYVGAEDLSLQAAKLEKAARERDHQYLVINLEPTRQELKALANYLKNVLNEAHELT
ncbi:MAG: response regulator [Deltaproteobacteria bacterium]|jgi:CheY-like chemotaxis protein/signal transduction histidine kinase|nr:response regulator [Deltaproteobacteria bacterium]